MYSSDFLKNATNNIIRSHGLAIIKAGIFHNQCFISQFIIVRVIASHIAIRKSCHILTLNGQISIHISKSHASTCFGTIIFIVFLFKK